MTTDKRDLLQVLKKELEFLEKGGYRETARASWRPQFIFQDSPACLNFDPEHQPRPCSECALIQLVPDEMQKHRIPCRHIPVGTNGRTIEWFYRNGTEEELESALKQWLKVTIAGIESERAERAAQKNAPEVHVRAHCSRLTD